MTVSFVGSASAEATALTLPAHQAGDLIVVAAIGAGTITVPAGWFYHRQQPSATGGARSAVIAWKTAASGSETSGTWTGATLVAATVHRDSLNVLTLSLSSFIAGSTSAVVYPALSARATANTVTKLQDAASWLLGVVGLFNIGTDGLTSPSGMTNRVSITGATQYAIAIHDTDATVASWAATTFTANQAVGSSVFTIEILDTGFAKTAAASFRPVNIRGGADQ